MKYNFRTHKEMAQVYDERHERGQDDELYVVQCESGSQQLIFCGTRHTNDPGDQQFPEIKKFWDDFMTRDSKKLAICEGAVRQVEGKTEAEVIRFDNDPGYICWLASQAKIEIISPEPEKAAEVSQLVKEFGAERTILYYFARLMHQWARMSFAEYPDINVFIDRFIGRFSYPEINKLELTREKLFKIFKQETGKDFSFMQTNTIYNLMAPNRDEVASRCSEIRNASIFEAIKNAKAEGRDIFAVYGSGHAIVLEPALKELYSN